MKCLRLHLCERPASRPRGCREPAPATFSPLRLGQKRLANPQHDEDPRWTEMLERFHCTNYEQEYCDTISSQPDEDLYLSVQTLKFEGLEQQPRQIKSCFKYKRSTDVRNHRLFIKETIDGPQEEEEDRSSKLSSYYFDNYVQQILQSDKSQSPSESSCIQGLFNKLNKSTQGPTNNSKENPPKSQKKVKANSFKMVMDENNKKDNENLIEDSKISFHKTAKRKSLTISRTQSPETVQIIRVDVVCNRSPTCSISNDYDDKKHEVTIKTPEPLNYKTNNYYNKYVLTNTIKSLEENLASGTVTLLCKTFKLSDRAKTAYK